MVEYRVLTTNDGKKKNRSVYNIWLNKQSPRIANDLVNPCSPDLAGLDVYNQRYKQQL